jgi:hypothetical protein
MSNTGASNHATIDIYTISSLHEAYQEASKCELTQEQFLTLLTFYPALLVVSADGEIDKEESIYVKHIAKFMANSYGESRNYQESDLEVEFCRGLSFLSQQEQTWKDIFLQVLHDYLQEIPLLKENISEVMLMFADSSEYISDDESEVIKYIATHLEMDLSLFELG